MSHRSLYRYTHQAIAFVVLTLSVSSWASAAEVSDTALNFSGELFFPPPCTVTLSNVVDLGNIPQTMIKDRDYRQDIPLIIDCDGALKDTLSYQFAGDAHYSDTLRTSRDMLYLIVRRDDKALNLNEWYTFEKNSPPAFKVGTFKWDFDTPTLGEFTASVTFKVKHN